MRTIPLTRGLEAIVDDEDFQRVSVARWYAQPNWHTTYAEAHIRIDGKRTMVTMHRYILEPSPEQMVDHLDGDGLNNRRSNLRICTNAQNKMNSRPHTNTASGFKGVDFSKPYGKWQARIQLNGQRIWLGYFENKEDAAQAYDHAARQLFGPFARTNFQEDGARRRAK